MQLAKALALPEVRGLEERSPDARKVVPHRAEALLDELAAAYRWDDAEAAARAGAPVVTGMNPWWAPLLRACGAIPASDMGRLRGRSHEAVSLAESDFHVPSEFCTVIKAQIGGLGLRMRQPGGTAVRRILVFGGACEPSVAMAELARGEGYDVHVVQPLTAFKMDPSRRSEYIAFYEEEARRVARWLTGREAGQEIDESRLGDLLRSKNEVTRRIVRVLELRLANPLYFPMTRVSQLLLASVDYHAVNDFELKRRRFVELLDTLLAELEWAGRQPVRPHVPLVLAGNMFNLDMTRTIDLSGGAIVGSLMAITTLYREDVPPITALAEYLLDMQLKGESSDQAGAVASARRHRIEEEVRRTRAKGVIVSGTTGCPYTSLTRQMEQDFFTTKGIPVLSVEGTAHQDPITEEVKMRVKAFIEMLA
jgi:benzoyl-CoA reductase/2-hydroxyglutaryl-CoA dehydratase subunit BcrC/BadD/HgdB